VIPVLVVTLVVFSVIPKVPLKRNFDPQPALDPIGQQREEVVLIAVERYFAQHAAPHCGRTH